MKLITAGLTSVILAAGGAGSVQAYRVTAEPAEEVVSATPPRAKQRTVVQWAPCEAPSRLDNGTCVTDVVRTVVRPAPPAESPEAPDYSDDHPAPQQIAEVRDDVDDDVYGPERGESDDDRDDDDEGDRDDDGDERYGEDREARDDHQDEDDEWFLGDREEDLREDDD